ncbi:MAG: hypothetical protein QOG75_2254 [Mycobacterium sp.]|jgi:hypothetical protein|nr:hypothetical protein [Mycobacterium sp.]
MTGRGMSWQCGPGVVAKTLRRVGMACVIALSAAAVAIGPTSRADPDDDVDYPYGAVHESPVVIQPLPVVTPRPSNWTPKFPFPYNQTMGSVTDADITSGREMCQWYNAQYDQLIRQIDSLQFGRITPNGPGVLMGSGTDWDYSNGDLQQQADIVTANIDQSEDFLAPRVQALTQNQDHSGDLYFPLYQGKSFYLLWQHLSNVSAGIKSHQPDWFTGPSVQRVKRFGSMINRSHVCG